MPGVRYGHLCYNSPAISTGYVVIIDEACNRSNCRFDSRYQDVQYDPAAEYNVREGVEEMREPCIVRSHIMHTSCNHYFEENHGNKKRPALHS